MLLKHMNIVNKYLCTINNCETLTVRKIKIRGTAIDDQVNVFVTDIALTKHNADASATDFA